MALMFNISDDSETETMEDSEDSSQNIHKSGSAQRKQHLTVPDRLKGE